jgi:macrodomain Ter protein organizer (MatP/YcbG family)
VTATTIKVPSDLRDRLNREARADGVTVASVIERLLDERERAELYRRMREERAALTADERAELEAEYRVWDDAARVDAGRSDRDA